MSITKTVQDLIHQLQPYESIYSLRQATWGQNQFVLQPTKFNHNKPNGEFWHDLVRTHMMCHSDQLTKIYEVDHRGTFWNIKHNAISTLETFLNRNFADDKHKKLRIWYKRYIFQKEEFNDIVLNVFKVISDIHKDTDPEQKLHKNTVAVLEAYFIKNFKEEHMPPKRKRRARRR